MKKTAQRKNRMYLLVFIALASPFILELISKDGFDLSQLIKRIVGLFMLFILGLWFYSLRCAGQWIRNAGNIYWGIFVAASIGVHLYSAFIFVVFLTEALSLLLTAEIAAA